jgi:hypothetical protein
MVKEVHVGCRMSWDEQGIGWSSGCVKLIAYRYLDESDVSTADFCNDTSMYVCKCACRHAWLAWLSVELDPTNVTVVFSSTFLYRNPLLQKFPPI